MLCHSKTVLLWQSDVAGNNKTYLGLHVKCPELFSYFNQSEFSQKISTEVLKVKRESGTDTCGQMDEGNRQF